VTNSNIEYRNPKQYQISNIEILNNDELVKSKKCPATVIPAKAGIKIYRIVTKCLDTGFHRCDDFLRLNVSAPVMGDTFEISPPTDLSGGIETDVSGAVSTDASGGASSDLGIACFMGTVFFFFIRFLLFNAGRVLRACAL
jgi:hypothetical protein